MSSWSAQRRFVYLLGLIGVLVLFVGVPAFFFFYEAPTCTDGEQNGTEDGVDCGGECPIVCSFSAAAPVRQWDRFFQVIPGVYATLALVQNPNSTVGAFDVPYSFKLRDAENVLVYERKGRVYLPPNTTVPIFETGLQTGSRIPTRSEFILGEPVWVRRQMDDRTLQISGQKLDNETTQPVLTATVRNSSNDAVGEFAAVAILYDEEENVVQSSRTILEGLAPRSEATLTFTWPQPFVSSVAKIEIVTVFPPPAR